MTDQQDAVERLDPDVLRANLDECAGDYAYQVTRRDGGERLSGVEVALIIAYGIAERTIDALEAQQRRLDRCQQKNEQLTEHLKSKQKQLQDPEELAGRLYWFTEGEPEFDMDDGGKVAVRSPIGE